jgi:hypothetical protein
LTPLQKAELLDVVTAGPDPAIHGVVRWRCVDLQAEVERRFSVKVHVNTIGVWLHALGLTRLQPRPHHPKKAPEAEATFKKSPTTREVPRLRTAPGVVANVSVSQKLLRSGQSGAQPDCPRRPNRNLVPG